MTANLLNTISRRAGRTPRRHMTCIPAAWAVLVLSMFCAAAAAQDDADAYVIPASTPEHIRAAVQSPARTDEHRARDAARKPAEVLTMAGIQPGDHIIELAGFGLYYTTMLAEAVGPEGRVDVYDLPYTERFGGEAAREFVANRPNVTYNLEDYNTVTLPQNVDAIFNVLYYHDLVPQEIDTAAFNRRKFDALKPGGIYLVIDHKAEDGSGWRDAATIHRMGVETIVEEVTAAGFELAVESDLLANPDDDRTQMVFTPGTRGATDRALFIFRKP
jgi:predicted methyltransferase